MSGKRTTLKREILKAVKDKKPLLIVEGVDDVTFYETIVYHITNEKDDIGNMVNIRPIEVFGRGAGCTQITIQFQEIKDWITNDMLDYVRGIIDRDSFFYIASHEKVHERKSIKGVFILNYYSYESHFLTKNLLKILISKITYCEKSKIDEIILDFLMNKIQTMVYDDLFYIGMECLRNALESNTLKYKAICTYEDSEFDIGDFNKRRNKFLRKIDKEYLDNLAINKGINKNINDIKKIVKGKHLLYSYASQIYYEIDKLEKRCKKDDNVLICNYENDCIKERCRWKNKASYDARQIYFKLQEEVDIKEIEYISNELRKLKIKCNDRKIKYENVSNS